MRRYLIRSMLRDELKRLQEQTPLLSVAEVGEWMSLHTMAREVLHERYRLIPDDERRAMAAKASDWLSGAGLFEAAAERALAAGLSERAYAMAEGVVQQMLMGRPDRRRPRVVPAPPP